MNNNILIGLSWPYANGELHIGHLGSSIPADIIARYYRLKGDKVCFVSGSDCFGTPISIKAQTEGKKPNEVAEYYHDKFVKIFKDLHFSFDNYTKTNNNHHIEFAKEFHKELYNTEYVYKKDEQRLFCSHCNRFLPDRYVIGLCPNCGSKAKGDSCENCGKILEPEDLLEPQCGICGETPGFKDNFQYYLSLSKLESKLKKFYIDRKDSWSLNAINLTERYFQQGLIDRAISRDLDWGVPVPIEELKEKVIYNWGENVLGYISACKEFCETKGLNYLEWFGNENSKHIYVHAKDNIPFHTIIFPALLLANDKYHLPDEIFAYEYVTNNGQKISKSKGTYLTSQDLLDKYDVDFLRYYFAKNINDKKDLDYSAYDFANSVNGELINNWGNFVNRTLSFVKNKFDSKIGKFEIRDEIAEKIEETFKVSSLNIEKGKVGVAVREIFELVDYANKFFDSTQPWNVYKEDKIKCEELCYQYLSIIANVAILLNPFTPKGCSKVLNWINLKLDKYTFIYPNKFTINEFSPLYERIQQ